MKLIIFVKGKEPLKSFVFLYAPSIKIGSYAYDVDNDDWYRYGKISPAPKDTFWFSKNDWEIPKHIRAWALIL